MVKKLANSTFAGALQMMFIKDFFDLINYYLTDVCITHTSEHRILTVMHERVNNSLLSAGNALYALANQPVNHDPQTIAQCTKTGGSQHQQGQEVQPGYAG
jgi:hypothetical protein